MANTRDIRRRIKSVKNTAQITKAMQMVAASKMRKAQEAALSGRSYAEGLDRMIHDLKERAEDIHHPLWGRSKQGSKQLVLVISTDKGLCGALNTNLLRETNSFPDDASFVTIGKRAKAFVARTGKHLLADFEISEKASFLECKQVSQFLIDRFTALEADAVTVLYTHYINTLVQKPVATRILPMEELTGAGIALAGKDAGESLDKAPNIDYHYEPSSQTVMSELLPAYIHFQVYHMILEARASEHSARMVAMKSATDNAKSLIKDLTLEYNKVRQAGITNEILEIAAAQMAMNS
ncbi:MAG: ATP synthase F1 subunit gamma [Candidatus Methylacidiphilales bacterium]|nr:ATP synthase F1 subunit gamma [Candidatus Methylacidiphilales bacterium]